MSAITATLLSIALGSALGWVARGWSDGRKAALRRALVAGRRA